MAVADVYDALISRRVYKGPVPHSTAVTMMASESGTAFDPVLIEAFLEVQEEFRSIAMAYCDLEEEQIMISL